MLRDGIVCRRCNNGLGHLDQAVIDDLDFPAFMAGIPRKKGRPPAILSRGNVLGTVEVTGPTLSFNMDPTATMAHDGSRLAGYRGSRRNVRAELNRSGDLAEVKFDVPFGENPKFIRGVTKIAFSIVAHRIGHEYLLDPRFNAVRRFVVNGEGTRHIVVTSDGDAKYRHEITPLTFKETGEQAVIFRLGVVEFLVEFSAEDRFPDLVMLAQACRPGRWAVLPMAA